MFEVGTLLLYPLFTFGTVKHIGLFESPPNKKARKYPVQVESVESAG